MIGKPILITGCARSGTSMIAGIISVCGAFGGHIGDSKKDVFENHEIKQSMMKPYFRRMKADPAGQYPLPDLDNPEIVERMVRDGKNFWRYKIENIVQKQGYNGSSMWFYKGSKICLVWPIWDSAFPDANWIIVRRRTDDIILSCMRTGFMSAFKTVAGWKAWANVHEECFLEMKEAGLSIQEIWPQDIIKGDMTKIKRIVENLGLVWNEQAVKDFIAPNLWKENKHGKSHRG